jgi:hypothetical protein
VGLLDRSGREEVINLVALAGFNPNEFRVTPVIRKREGSEVIVSRTRNGCTYTKGYSMSGNGFWLLAFERDLQSEAFGPAR